MLRKHKERQQEKVPKGSAAVESSRQGTAPNEITTYRIISLHLRADSKQNQPTQQARKFGYLDGRHSQEIGAEAKRQAKSLLPNRTIHHHQRRAVKVRERRKGRECNVIVCKITRNGSSLCDGQFFFGLVNVRRNIESTQLNRVQVQIRHRQSSIPLAYNWPGDRVGSVKKKSKQ
jgi:hypothetical protein